MISIYECPCIYTKLNSFTTPEVAITMEEFEAQLLELQRLQALKEQKDKSNAKILTMFNKATYDAQAQKWNEHELKKQKAIEVYNLLIHHRANELPITKISYTIDKYKVPSMR
ncbi:hypothetical protein Tco_0844086, partial [Tanacetum coccineum]